MELSGKIAIVTGASRGIGAAIALELGEAGATVIVNYRSSAEKAAAIAAQISAGPGVGVAAQGDVSTVAGCEALLAAAEAHGPVDILVNNAGVVADGLLSQMSDEQWDQVMTTNAGGCFRMSRAVIHSMIRRRQGSIINISSISGLRGNSGQFNYSAAKAAIIGMTRSLAREVGKRKIRVNVVAPGFIDTDMVSEMPADIVKEIKRSIPMRRLGVPADIAPMVRFLAGPSSAYVTGQIFVVDGGLSC